MGAVETSNLREFPQILVRNGLLWKSSGSVSIALIIRMESGMCITWFTIDKLCLSGGGKGADDKSREH